MKKISILEGSMRYTTAEPGRIFVLRLEDGDIVHEVIEQFADEHQIEAATLLVVGGADDGSRLVVGPGQDRGIPLEIMKETLHHVHEVAGTGTLFRDREGTPLVHIHMACGRNTQTITGCIREGVRVWHVMEVVIQELTNCSARRALEEPLGLKLLQP